MAQYIDKSVLVAEIKAHISDTSVLQKAGLIKKRDANQKIILFKSVLSLIDTLEVKDVNLELNSFDAIVCKNGNTYLKEIDRDAIGKSVESFKDGDKVKVIIKAL